MPDEVAGEHWQLVSVRRQDSCATETAMKVIATTTRMFENAILSGKWSEVGKRKSFVEPENLQVVQRLAGCVEIGGVERCAESRRRGRYLY